MQQWSTKAACYKVFTKPCLSGSAWSRIWTGYCENLYIDDLSQHSEKAMKAPTELWTDLEQAPKIRDDAFPTCQVLHMVTTRGSPVCWPITASPLLYWGACQPVFDWEARRFKGWLFCRARERMEVLRDAVSVDVQLKFACWLFPMVVYLCLSRV